LITEKDFQLKIVEAAKKQRWHTVEPSNWFHCSGAGTCHRQLWNGKKGKYDLTDKSIMAMNVGTVIHTWLEEHLDLGPSFKKEIKVAKHYGDIVATGTTDLYDEDTVYDFKTIRALWYLPKVDPANKSSPKTFYNHHVPQLNMYADILGKENISIVYIDKGNMDVKQFTMKADKKIVEETIKKFKEVNAALGKDENPFDYCGCFVCDEEQRRNKDKDDAKEGWKRV